MISKKIFEADGSNIRFLSDFIIRSEQFTRVYNYMYDINGVAGDTHTNGLTIRTIDSPDSSDLVTIDKWDLVDNSVSFYMAPPTGSRVYIEVATTSEEFGSTITQPSVEKAEEAAAAAELSAANALISENNASASETAATLSEASALASETAAALSETNAATSETNASASETNASASETAASLSEANAATSEANALASETVAALSEVNSLASETKAEKWAEETEDVEVEVGKYSAKHWAAKAQVGNDVAVVDTLQDLAAADITLNTIIVNESIRGGIFQYDATQSAVNDGGLVLDGWVRQYSGVRQANWYIGVDPTGVVDSTASINGAMDDTLIEFNGTYKVQQTLTDLFELENFVGSYEFQSVDPAGNSSNMPLVNDEGGISTLYCELSKPILSDATRYISTGAAAAIGTTEYFAVRVSREHYYSSTHLSSVVIFYREIGEDKWNNQVVFTTSTVQHEVRDVDLTVGFSNEYLLLKISETQPNTTRDTHILRLDKDLNTTITHTVTGVPNNEITYGNILVTPGGRALLTTYTGTSSDVKIYRSAETIGSTALTFSLANTFSKAFIAEPTMAYFGDKLVLVYRTDAALTPSSPLDYGELVYSYELEGNGSFTTPVELPDEVHGPSMIPYNLNKELSIAVSSGADRKVISVYSTKDLKTFTESMQHTLKSTGGYPAITNSSKGVSIYYWEDVFPTGAVPSIPDTDVLTTRVSCMHLDDSVFELPAHYGSRETSTDSISDGEQVIGVFGATRAYASLGGGYKGRLEMKRDTLVKGVCLYGLASSAGDNSVQLRIRDESNTILALTGAVVISDTTTSITNFYFPASLTLTMGHIYAIDIVGGSKVLLLQRSGLTSLEGASAIAYNVLNSSNVPITGHFLGVGVLTEN